MRYFLVLLLILCFKTHYAQFPQELQDDFQEIIEDQLESFGAIGISVAVKSADDEWVGVAGRSSASEDVTTDMTFGVGSVSKTITSAVIMDLWSEGLIHPNDTLGQYVRDFNNVDPGVTVHQLLDHTSGIYNYTSHPDFFQQVLLSSSTILVDTHIIENYVLPAVFPAGEQWSYSNTNYLLLGMIVESITGNPFYVEARERFDFDTRYPSLNMPPFEGNFDNMAHMWGDLGLGRLDLFEAGISMNGIFSAAGSAGAYQSTALDICNWAYDLFGGSLLDEQILDAMKEVNAPSTNYGYGVFLASLPCEVDVVGHTGGIGYTSATFYSEENELAVSVHCNDSDVENITVSILAELMCTYDEFMTTDIQDYRVDFDLAISPNPSTSFVEIKSNSITELEGDIELKVYNTLGELVYVQNCNIHELNSGVVVHHLWPKGMYQVVLSSQDGYAVEKLMVMD